MTGNDPQQSTDGNGKNALASLPAGSDASALIARAGKEIGGSHLNDATGEIMDRRWHPVFIRAMKESGIVRIACEAAGVGRRTAYDHKALDPEFSKAWDEAKEDAVDALEAAAERRAVQGVQRVVSVGGKREIVIEYSDRLLEFLLRGQRPRVYNDRVEHSGPGGASIPVRMVFVRDEPPGQPEPPEGGSPEQGTPTAQ